MSIEKTIGKAKSALGDVFAKGIQGIEAAGRKVIGRGKRSPKIGGKGLAIAAAGVALVGAGAFFFFTAPGKRLRQKLMAMFSKVVPDFGEAVLAKEPTPQETPRKSVHMNSWERRQRAPIPPSPEPS